MSKKLNELTKRARSIRLIGMDVDGVLTSGEIVVLQTGEEIKFWNAKDRLLLAHLGKTDIPLRCAWITGRASKAVTSAAKDLKIKYVVQKSHDKKGAFDKILKKEKLSYAQAAFIGDDLIDLGLLRRVGLSVCPRDAASDVKKIVHYVSPYKGGRGVVRDVLELILKAQNKWDSITRHYLA
ncbi:hypothetical protein BVX98_02785 [bacterium F11]|nr:hypothetical protein BVX98_02785 [bacterium F11]